MISGSHSFARHQRTHTVISECRIPPVPPVPKWAVDLTGDGLPVACHWSEGSRVGLEGQMCVECHVQWVERDARLRCAAQRAERAHAHGQRSDVVNPHRWRPTGHSVQSEHWAQSRDLAGPRMGRIPKPRPGAPVYPGGGGGGMGHPAVGLSNPRRHTPEDTMLGNN